jgi:hypothetical protein
MKEQSMARVLAFPWGCRLVALMLVAVMILSGLIGCSESSTTAVNPSTTSTPMPMSTSDVLTILVEEHWDPSTYRFAGRAPTVFAGTIRDSAPIARVRQAIASVAVSSPDATFNCPTYWLPYYSYSIQFFHDGKAVEDVSIDATACEFISVRDADKAAVTTRCCPGSDFWTRLQQATGAPLPE